GSSPVAVTSNRIGNSDPAASRTASRRSPEKRLSSRSFTSVLGTASTNVPLTTPTGLMPANHVRQVASETCERIAPAQPVQSCCTSVTNLDPPSKSSPQGGPHLWTDGYKRRICRDPIAHRKFAPRRLPSDKRRFYWAR